MTETSKLHDMEFARLVKAFTSAMQTASDGDRASFQIVLASAARMIRLMAVAKDARKA